MFTENNKPPKRGRPPGRTAEGEAMRESLYRAALTMISERGYEAATLRDVATQVGVSPALLYRYFPNKRAVLLAFYDDLSQAFASRAAEIPPGKWRDRCLYVLELSLDVLRPHRTALQALAPTLVSDADDGVFARGTSVSRLRVQTAFQHAVLDAADAPYPALAEALGRLLYLLHLGIILWWLLDRSPKQRATGALVALFRQILPSAARALYLRPVKTFVREADALFVEALLTGSKDEAALTSATGPA
jgi:AcrR family transcriptional regulator